MPAWVTLKNGKVLEYNTCAFVKYDTNEYALREVKDGPLIALIPTNNIERFEFERPDKIYREPMKDKLPILK